MRNRTTKSSLVKGLITGLMLSLILIQPSFAQKAESPHQEQQATAKDLEEQRHSIQGLLVPFVLFNSLQLAYEYKITPQLGVRADGLILLSLGGSVLGGGLALSYIAAEGRSDRASHGLEFDLGVGTGVGGGGHCDASLSDCSVKSAHVLRGFVGYRYQKFSGYQFRVGLSPVVTMQGSWAVLPEMTLGISF